MRRPLLFASLAVVAASCTTRPVNTLPPAANAASAMPLPPQAGMPSSTSGTPVPAAALVDHFGDSMDTAVPVPKDAPNEGIDFENNWIYDRFGRFRRNKWAMGQANGRHYKIITVELPDASMRTVYFDVTESWNSWTPPAPQPH